MLEFLRKLFAWAPPPPPPFTGALPEYRTDEEVAEDVQFADIVGAVAPVRWEEKRAWRTYPVFNQRQSSMCGAFSLAKYLGILYSLSDRYDSFIEFSQEDIYQRRMNRPGAGMYLSDMFSIAKQGVVPKLLTGVPITTDADADQAVIEPWKRRVGAEIALSGEPIRIPAGHFDTIASVIQETGKGVIMLLYFTREEWSRLVPQVSGPLTATSPQVLRHFVVATDYGLRNGLPVLQIDDSAHFGGLAVRYLTRDFVRARNTAALYSMNFKFAPPGGRPKYDGSTKSLQDCLKIEGLFPANVDSTGHFGTITRRAVIAFQQKYGIAQTGTVGPVTEAKLKELYN